MKKTEESAKYKIEDLAKGIDAATFAAVCVMKKWSPGKSVSQGEFDQAVKQFLNAPAGRTKRG
jgi:response regulator of citrate/malate metabolism